MKRLIGYNYYEHFSFISSLILSPPSIYHCAASKYLMDPERVSTLPQLSEVTPPVLGEDKTMSIPVERSVRPPAIIDTSTPSGGNVLSSANSEKSDVSETLIQHRPSTTLRHHPSSNIKDHFSQHIPARRPESSQRRETRINSDDRFASAIQVSNVDWIVPKEEKVN